jgi:two-component system sensor histidine kinase/response regulator
LGASRQKRDRAMLTSAFTNVNMPRLKILLAEDNPINQKVSLRMLQKLKYDVTVADNGKQALQLWQEAVDKDPFDLVLMDIQMPEMDGFETTEKIRELEKSKNSRTHIIALTAHATSEDRDQCLAFGMDGYLSKPIRFEKLFKMIKECPAESPKKQAAPSNQEQKNEPIWVDQKELLKRMEGDWELLIELIEIFKENSVDMIGEIYEAFGEADVEKLARSAHSMKGVLANFSAIKAHATTLKLEQLAKEGKLEQASAIFDELKVQVVKTRDILEQMMAKYSASASLMPDGA